MAWTTPNTVSPGGIFSASDYNTYLRDNLSYLFNGRAGQTVKYDNGADYSTSSTTYANIDGTNLSITLTVNSGKVLLAFFGAFFCSTGQYGAIDFSVDGVRVNAAGTLGSGWLSAQGTNTLIVLVTGLSVGSHVFKIMWRSIGGTAFTLYAGSGVATTDFIPTLSALEVG
jgi:hypothetical protein